MPDSFQEIVQFDWRVDQTDTASQKMIDNLLAVERAMGGLVTTSTETFQNVATSTKPAIDATIQLNANLAMILANINAINSTGGVRVPVSGGGAGGATASQVRDTQSGVYVGPQAMTAAMVAWSSAPATNVRGPGDMPGFQYNALTNIGGGGDAMRGPNGQFLSGNDMWRLQGRDPNTGQFLSPSDMASTYSKPTLNNLGLLGMNDPRYQTQIFGPGGPTGLSQGQNDALNGAMDPATLPGWLRNLMGLGGPVAVRPNMGFTSDFGNVSPVGSIGGLLSGPGQTVFPGYGSSFGMSGGLWGGGGGAGPTINNGGDQFGGFGGYSYNSSNGFYSFGNQSGIGSNGGNFGDRSQNAFSYGPAAPGMQGDVFPGQGNSWGQGWPWNNGVSAGGGAPPNIINGTSDPGGFESQSRNLKVLSSQLDDTNKAAGGLDATFARIATRVAIYAVLYGAIQLVVQSTKQWADEMVQLDDVSSRIGFINGQGIGATQAQFTQAAQYGISPAQAGAGLITASQLGSSPQQQQQAGQLSMVFGATQYNDILTQLNRTQEQMKATGTGNVDVMNFIAQSYRTATGSADDYFTALQKGIELHAQFGLSATSMGLALEQASKDTGLSIDQTAVMAQSVLVKLNDPATQKKLEPYGITGGTPAQMLKQITDLVAQHAAIGDTAGVQSISDVLGGGIGSFSRVPNLAAFWKDLGVAIDNTNPKLADANAWISTLGDTGVVKINMMTAAWGLFLQSIGNTSAIKTAASDITTLLNTQTAGNQVGTQWSSMTPDQQAQAIAKFTQQTGVPAGISPGLNTGGLIGMGGQPQVNVTEQMYQSQGAQGATQGFFDSKGNLNLPAGIQNMINRQAIQMAYNKALDDWMLNNGAGSSSGTGVSVPLSGAYDERQANIIQHRGVSPWDTSVTNPPPFGGIQDLPKGTTGADFQKLVQASEATLTKLGVPITDQTLYFYDKSTDTWTKMLADTNAVRIATEKLANSTTSLGGILPQGETVQGIQKLIDQYTPMLNAAGIKSDPVTVAYLDMTTNTLKTIHGDTAAIQLATELSAKLLAQQITGAFNVPAGGEAVVAFYALQQGFGPNTAGSGGMNGAASGLTSAGTLLSSAAVALLQVAAHFGVTGAQSMLASNATLGFQTPQTSNYSRFSGTQSGFQTPTTSNYTAPSIPNSAGTYDRSVDRSFTSLGNPAGRTGYQGGTADDKLYEDLHQKFKEAVDWGLGLQGPNMQRTSRNPGPTGQAGPNTTGSAPVTVNNVIRVNIDSRQVAYQMNRKTYRQFESTRNSVAGAPNSVVGM